MRKNWSDHIPRSRVPSRAASFHFVWFVLTDPIVTNKNRKTPNAICTIGVSAHYLAFGDVALR